MHGFNSALLMWPHSFTFSLQLLDTGSISELELGHTGPNSWDVREVFVTNTTTGASARFEINK
eukprot:scaffold132098_cov18-Tisochrysis_lutea.AAC.3